MPGKCCHLSPGSFWQAQLCSSPLPLSRPSAADGQEAVILFPHPALPPRPPPRPLSAPGSWEAIPNKLALSLAFTTWGKTAPGMPCQDADEGKEPSLHIEGSREGLGLSLPSSDPSGELSLSIPASYRSTQCLCVPELFPVNYGIWELERVLGITL